MTEPRSSARNAPAWVTAILVVLGILLIVVAVVYFSRSADKLPSFFPGHAAGDTKTHVKHGIAALVLGLIAFVGAWFSTGQKRS